MERCKTCKHWKAQPGALGWGEIHICDYPDAGEYFEANVSGGADIATSATFGCVLHESNR